ncbi:hypothetical protein D9619_004054 [Psilocybe cf. subviscida]|uniref:pyranose dehydrogenase (acceptor) n=1 Tax=Psilocybe cf. subviscida TaxID=2480587 RepID=A0A8H5F8B7_9AGAR|nr:hypothetical protein D9619_004054 [Psilocybe cf. subviscida]
MNPSKFLSFVLASVLAAPSLAVTLTQPTQLSTNSYDYIIVGAGTAGLALANRLTEDPKVSVLVLEAGISDEGVVPMQAPFLGPTLSPNTPFDWNYTVTPQVGLNGRSFPYPRGKVLGGSSSINYLIHQFGTKEDWNRYADVSGDQGWSWDKMRKYVRKHERIVPPIDSHNTAGQYLPGNHGTNGVVSVSLQGYNTSIDARVLQATKELPGEFPFNQDLSGGDQPMLGIGFVQTNAGNGTRSSSSTSYLAQANSRPNLTVLINATVTKLLSTAANDKKLKAFRSVQFSNTPGTSPSAESESKSWTVKARKEIVLSAGSVGSAQILLLSGIGGKSNLQKLNIPVEINNPNVGDNLSDHALLPNIYRIQNPANSTDVVTDSILANANAAGDVLTQYVSTRTGLFANNIANKYGFFRLPKQILQRVSDPSPGPLSPHWEVLPVDFYINPGIPRPGDGTYMTFVLALLTPTSRGSVTLRSKNPFDKPIINPNMLTTVFDITATREAVKAIKRLAAAPAFSDYIVAPYGEAFAAATTDKNIDTYIRGLTTTVFHPTGTASMTSADSSHGVVNPDLTVKGTEGLRVVDASVFPFTPSCHTAGPTYLLAERAADLIKRDAH